MFTNLLNQSKYGPLRVVFDFITIHEIITSKLFSVCKGFSDASFESMKRRRIPSRTIRLPCDDLLYRFITDETIVFEDVDCLMSMLVLLPVRGCVNSFKTLILKYSIQNHENCVGGEIELTRKKIWEVVTSILRGWKSGGYTKICHPRTSDFLEILLKEIVYKLEMWNIMNLFCRQSLESLSNQKNAKKKDLYEVNNERKEDYEKCVNLILRDRTFDNFSPSILHVDSRLRGSALLESGIKARNMYVVYGILSKFDFQEDARNHNFSFLLDKRVLEAFTEVSGDDRKPFWKFTGYPRISIFPCFKIIVDHIPPVSEHFSLKMIRDFIFFGDEWSQFVSLLLEKTKNMPFQVKESSEDYSIWYSPDPLLELCDLAVDFRSCENLKAIFNFAKSNGRRLDDEEREHGEMGLLVKCCRNDFSNCLELITQQRKDLINFSIYPPEDGESLEVVCVKYGSYKCLKYLLETDLQKPFDNEPKIFERACGAKIEPRREFGTLCRDSRIDRDHGNSFHDNYDDGCLEIVKLLYNYYVDSSTTSVKEKGRIDFSDAINSAARSGNIEIIRYLLNEIEENIDLRGDEDDNVIREYECLFNSLEYRHTWIFRDLLFDKRIEDQEFRDFINTTESGKELLNLVFKSGFDDVIYYFCKKMGWDSKTFYKRFPVKEVFKNDRYSMAVEREDGELHYYRLSSYHYQKDLILQFFIHDDCGIDLLSDYGTIKLFKDTREFKGSSREEESDEIRIREDEYKKVVVSRTYNNDDGDSTRKTWERVSKFMNVIQESIYQIKKEMDQMERREQHEMFLRMYRFQSEEIHEEAEKKNFTIPENFFKPFNGLVCKFSEEEEDTLPEEFNDDWESLVKVVRKGKNNAAVNSRFMKSIHILTRDYIEGIEKPHLQLTNFTGYLERRRYELERNARKRWEEEFLKCGKEKTNKEEMKIISRLGERYEDEVRRLKEEVAGFDERMAKRAIEESIKKLKRKVEVAFSTAVCIVNGHTKSILKKWKFKE